MWEDLRFPATQTKQGNTLLPDFDYTNIGLLFPQNDDTEIAYIIAQIPHAWKLGSNIRPHIHFIQTSADIPIFKIDYKWYDNNGTVPATWTTIATTDCEFTWSSGSLLQICSFPEIDGSGITGVSSILDIKLYRDDNVVTGDVLVKEFDIHYLVDADGSRQEYIK